MHIGFASLLLQGVVAVLSGGTVDVLCHAAVRARNAGVMLAACRSAAGLQEFRDLEGQLVAVEAVSGVLPFLTRQADRVLHSQSKQLLAACLDCQHVWKTPSQLQPIISSALHECDRRVAKSAQAAAHGAGQRQHHGDCRRGCCRQHSQTVQQPDGQAALESAAARVVRQLGPPWSGVQRRRCRRQVAEHRQAAGARRERSHFLNMVWNVREQSATSARSVK